mgnify:CR=1 FL=1
MQLAAVTVHTFALVGYRVKREAVTAVEAHGGVTAGAHRPES